MDVFVEIGSKRTFASAVQWPGWSRSGKTEEAALAQLAAYGPRYQQAVGLTPARLPLPETTADLVVIERLKGSSGTDFGVPSALAQADEQPVNGEELAALADLWRSAWAYFDSAARKAQGVTLTVGPRGGGRSLEKIRMHTMESEAAYANALGARSIKPTSDIAQDEEFARAAFLDAVTNRAEGLPPERTVRSARLWIPREAIRRSIWHTLDHAWEIEDRNS